MFTPPALKWYVTSNTHNPYWKSLYSTANDPQPQMIPRPQMIPKMDRKWSSTASDPQSRPQMIPKEK